MILESIVLQNFGIYGGRQDVILSPQQEGRPIVLFGGMNGAGKTTFLDAVQLALYGPKAHCFNRGKLGYREYLGAAIHRDANRAEGASITIDFRRSTDGQTHSYRVIRAWREGIRGIEENVEVFRNGEPDAVLTDHWDEYIESHIPTGISHLFFFDAEQIKELADGDRAAELLGTAVHSLLGLDIVDRLETDLLALERRKKTGATKNSEETERVRHAEDELRRIEQSAQQTSDDTASRRMEVDRLAKMITTCEERFRLEGGELFQKRAELAAELAMFQVELESEEETLREIAAGPAPFSLVLPMLEQLEKQVRCEIEIDNTRLLVTALADRDKAIVDSFRKDGASANSARQLDEILSKDRHQRTVSVADRPYINAGNHVADEIHRLTTASVPEATRTIRNVADRAANIRERITRLETTLARVPAADAIAGLIRELEALRTDWQNKQAEVAALETKMQIIERQRVTADAAVERALTESAERQLGAEERLRIVSHSGKVRKTLDAFRTAVIRKHVERIEGLMLEAFQALLRKSNLISGLKINPETFEVALTGGDGKPLAFDRLSAGERQLLATSLLWGLARASGRPLPTIIDTPLGRLDSSHRRHLVERYFPVASHQVILLSTDEEIDEDSLNRLRPFIDRTYYMSFDEASRSTSITPGYFWNHEAAG